MNLCEKVHTCPTGSPPVGAAAVCFVPPALGGELDGEYKKVDSLLFHLSSTLLHFFIVVILIMPAFFWTIMMNRNSDVLQVNCGTLDLLAGQCTAPSNLFSGIVHPTIAFFLLLFYVYSISAYLFRDLRKICLYFETKKFVYKWLENKENEENDQTVWKEIIPKAGETALRRSANKRDKKRKKAPKCIESIGTAIDQWNTTPIRFLLGDIGDKVLMKIVKNELECHLQPMLTISRENPLPFLGLESGLCSLFESNEEKIKNFRRNTGMRWFWEFSILFLVFTVTFIFMSFLLYLTLSAAVAPERIVPVIVSIGSTLRVALVTFANFEEKRAMLVKASLEALSSVQLDDPKCEICSEPLGEESCFGPHCKHSFHTKCRDGLKKFGIENGCRACFTGQNSAGRKLYEDACRIYFKLKELVGRDEASWSALTAQQQQQIKEVSNKLRDAADQGEEAAVAMLTWLTVDQRSEIQVRGGFSSLAFDNLDKEAARCWFQKMQPEICMEARKICDSLLIKGMGQEKNGQGIMDLHTTAQEQTRIKYMFRLFRAGASKADELHADLFELLDFFGKEDTLDLSSSATQAEDGKAGDRKHGPSKLLQRIQEEINRPEMLFLASKKNIIKGGKGKIKKSAKKLKIALEMIKQSKDCFLKKKLIELMATEFEKKAREALLNELYALDVEELQQHKHYIAMTHLAEQVCKEGKEKLENNEKKLKMALAKFKQSKTLKEKMLHSMETHFKNGASLTTEDLETMLNELCALEVQGLQQHKHCIVITPLAEQVCKGAAKKLKMALDMIKRSKALTENMLDLMETEFMDGEKILNELCVLDVEELQQHQHFFAVTYLAEQVCKRGKEKLKNAAKKLKTALETLQSMETQFKKGASLTKEELETLLNELCALDAEKLQQHQHFIAITHLAEVVSEGGKVKLESAAKKLKKALDIIKQSKALTEKMLHLMETQFKDDASLTMEYLETMLKELSALDEERLQQHEHFITMTSLAKQAMKYFDFMNQSQELVQDTLSGLGLGQGKAALVTFLTALCFGAFAAFVIVGCALFVDTQDIYSTIVASAVMLSAAFSKQKEDLKSNADAYETYRILKEKFVNMVVERLEEKKSELKTRKMSDENDDSEDETENKPKKSQFKKVQVKISNFATKTLRKNVIYPIVRSTKEKEGGTNQIELSDVYSNASGITSAMPLGVSLDGDDCSGYEASL